MYSSLCCLAGLGPTLEFYTLLSHELQRKSLGLWRHTEALGGGGSSGGAKRGSSGGKQEGAAAAAQAQVLGEGRERIS